jgi:mannobiose 2-epimerase
MIPETLKTAVRNELTGNILPFWIDRMSDPGGGYYGRINGNGLLHADASRGGILNARILWTFSAAYRQIPDRAYKDAAEWSFRYICEYFIDREFGGTFWRLTANGKPEDSKKQIYSQAFFIYALTEYFQATGDPVALQEAIGLFRLIEDHSFDPVMNGYFEAYSRKWTLLDDLRLSEKDENEKKTMNTHLHILEAYTNLFRVWKDPELTNQLRNLILIFIQKIVNPKSGHLELFFDEDWNAKPSLVSYGHDIEASWLIEEAARVLGDPILHAEVQRVCIRIAQAACEGLQPDGSMVYEKDVRTGNIDSDRHWWGQAEAMVGFLNACEMTHDRTWLDRAVKSWEYIDARLIDKEGGEWFWSISDQGIPNCRDDKAGFWKCPYHNGRMCLEVLRRD